MHQIEPQERIEDMKQLQGLYKKLAAVECPAGIYQSILARIARAEQRSARLRLGLFGALALASSLALVPTLQYAMQQFYASGFYDYLTLAFSDSSLVLTYWREFSMSLLEALPSLAVLFLLPLMFALVWSIRRIVKNARSAFAPIRLA